MAGIGSHTRAFRGRTDEWLTPPEILKALGPFDLDPCAPVTRPWPMAAEHYTIKDDGLTKPWRDRRCFLNPPYGPETAKWLKRLSQDSRNGIALVFARTETDTFHRWVWPLASALLFIKGRLHFYDVAGNRAKGNAGGPSVLIAYGSNNAKALRTSGIPGHYVTL